MPSDFEPKCMLQGNDRRQQAAVTNRGHLIPCCWIDQTEELKHPTMQKMLAVSKIDEVESIDEILLSEPWQKFAKHCKKWSGGKDQQKIEEYHIKGKSYQITNPNKNLNDPDYWKTWEYKENE